MTKKHLILLLSIISQNSMLVSMGTQQLYNATEKLVSSMRDFHDIAALHNIVAPDEGETTETMNDSTCKQSTC